MIQHNTKATFVCRRRDVPTGWEVIRVKPQVYIFKLDSLNIKLKIEPSKELIKSETKDMESA